MDITAGKAAQTNVKVLMSYSVPLQSVKSTDSVCIFGGGSPDGTEEVGGEELEVTAVELEPITGRTHQLRVHMAHAGYPMLGDTLYSPATIMNMSHRLELHARVLKFLQPTSQQEIVIHAPNLLTEKYWRVVDVPLACSESDGGCFSDSCVAATIGVKGREDDSMVTKRIRIE